nr:MAG TPA: hypothetical protein [Caudoviricetes sp.]
MTDWNRTSDIGATIQRLNHLATVTMLTFCHISDNLYLRVNPLGLIQDEIRPRLGLSHLFFM